MKAAIPRENSKEERKSTETVALEPWKSSGTNQEMGKKVTEERIQMTFSLIRLG